MERVKGGSLRVGILCSGTVFQRWQAEAIRQVVAVPNVSLVVLVIDQKDPSLPLGPAPRIRKRAWRTALYRRYRRRYFHPPAMAIEELDSMLSGVPRLSVTINEQSGRQRFSDEDLARISDHAPDVLLRFGFNILSGEILTLPRHGVWSYHHGDPSTFRGGPPGVWEILNNERVTGAVLQRLTEVLDGGHILKQGWFATVDHSLSETVDTVLMNSAVWPAQVMRELLAGDVEAATGELCKAPGPIYRYPGNLAFLWLILKQALNKMAFHRRELQVHEDWNVGILYEPITALVDGDLGQNVRWLPPPSANNFRADPFGYIGKDGRLNMLYEKYDHATGRGEIARMRPKKDNVLKRSRTMLQADSHLSYPYVVQTSDAVYVVPEQAEKGRVDLYRVSEDNDALELVCTLLEEPLFDPTLFEHDGKWWLMGTKAPLTNVALYVYHSDHFRGPYTEHALNPVKLDIRSARPAGTPFLHEGVLWRPGQDSSLTYGGRIALNRILELSTTRFQEETVKHIGPVEGSDWNKGMHTLCAMGQITLIDGKRTITVPERRKAVKQRKLDKLKQRTRK